MIIAGIDPSLTSAGVAVLVDGHPKPLSHHGFPGHNGASYQQRNRRGRWTAAQIRDAAFAHGKPDLAVIEAQPQHIQGQGIADRSYLWGKIFETFDWPGVPVVAVNPKTLKVWVTGRGNASKAEMVEAVQAWFPTLPIACDDEADALALALVGAHHLDEPMPFTPKPRHDLPQLDWPRRDMCVRVAAAERAGAEQ